MDEVFQRASNDGYSRPSQQPRYRPANLHTKTPISSYLTGQNFGILVAIFVIYIFQRKNGFGRLLSAHRDGGVLNLLMDWILDAKEYITAYYQMGAELCRNLRCYTIDDWWFYDDGGMSMPAATRSPLPRGRRRNMVAQIGASRMMSTSRMPELEETDPDKLKQADGAAASTSVTKKLIEPLEPAFQKEEDYPKGWLVWDPVLGVVTKVEADKRRQEQIRQEPQTQSSQKLELSNSNPEEHMSPARIQSQSPRSGGQRKQPSPAPYNNKNKATTPTRPLRTANNNVISTNASAMHTPQTIAANG